MYTNCLGASNTETQKYNMYCRRSEWAQMSLFVLNLLVLDVFILRIYFFFYTFDWFVMDGCRVLKEAAAETIVDEASIREVQLMIVPNWWKLLIFFILCVLNFVTVCLWQWQTADLQNYQSKWFYVVNFQQNLQGFFLTLTRLNVCINSYVARVGWLNVNSDAEELPSWTTVHISVSLV